MGHDRPRVSPPEFNKEGENGCETPEPPAPSGFWYRRAPRFVPPMPPFKLREGASALREAAERSAKWTFSRTFAAAAGAVATAVSVDGWRNGASSCTNDLSTIATQSRVADGRRGGHRHPLRGTSPRSSRSAGRGRR